MARKGKVAGEFEWYWALARLPWRWYASVAFRGQLGAILVNIRLRVYNRHYKEDGT